LKEFALEEIENCINTVSNGEHFFSPKIIELLADEFPTDGSLWKLTPSEKKILKLIAKDKTNKEIASLLFISYRTVEKHRSNIITKLKLEPKTNSLLIWAKEHQQKFI
jgi:DNA-binding NarL/FixJ family response regulator